MTNEQTTVTITVEELRRLLFLAYDMLGLNWDHLKKGPEHMAITPSEHDDLIDEHEADMAILRKYALKSDMYGVQQLIQGYIEEALEHEDPWTIFNTSPKERVDDFLRYLRNI